jgi:hypothetical protein
MVKDKLFGFGAGILLSTALTGFAIAQDTTTKTTTTTTTTQRQVVQNPDGSWTVIEYPVDKEVTVELTPHGMQGAKGWARVMRKADGTTVSVDLSGLPADAKNYYVYAVDPAGTVTMLGPVSIAQGASKATFAERRIIGNQQRYAGDFPQRGAGRLRRRADKSDQRRR